MSNYSYKFFSLRPTR